MSKVWKFDLAFLISKLDKFPHFDNLLNLVNFLLFDFWDLKNFLIFDYFLIFGFIDFSINLLLSSILLILLVQSTSLERNTCDDTIVFNINVSDTAILLEF